MPGSFVPFRLYWRAFENGHFHSLLRALSPFIVSLGSYSKWNRDLYWNRVLLQLLFEWSWNVISQRRQQIVISSLKRTYATVRINGTIISPRQVSRPSVSSKLVIDDRNTPGCTTTWLLDQSTGASNRSSSDKNTRNRSFTSCFLEHGGVRFSMIRRFSVVNHGCTRNNHSQGSRWQPFSIVPKAETMKTCETPLSLSLSLSLPLILSLLHSDDLFYLLSNFYRGSQIHKPLVRRETMGPRMSMASSIVARAAILSWWLFKRPRGVSVPPRTIPLSSAFFNVSFYGCATFSARWFPRSSVGHFWALNSNGSKAIEYWKFSPVGWRVICDAFLELFFLTAR